VPYFLAAPSAEPLWWVNFPGMEGQRFAATHYVGMSGVSLDSADPDFPRLDPNWAKKIGVFGYDRTTKVEDIADGPTLTIAVIQVPPHYKTPWMAGGGSTVRGVPESESVRPFVCTQHDGKPGTFAIMADGTVRFIPEDIPDDLFKAMCTINGGEKIDDKIDIATIVISPPATKPPMPMKPTPPAKP
jgi:hypothetical protein